MPGGNFYLSAKASQKEAFALLHIGGYLLLERT